MNMLMEISGNSVLNAVVWLVIAAVMYGVMEWGVAKIGVPEPFNRVIQVILVIFVVVAILNALGMIVGRPFIRWP